MKKNVSFAVFRSDAQVNQAIRNLVERGFKRAAISVHHPNQDGAKDFQAYQPTRVARGAEIGAGLGSVIGCCTGVLSATQELGLSLSSAQGAPSPLLGGLIGGVLGLFLGAGSGALIGIGTPARAPERHLGYLRSGGILVCVHSGDKESSELALSALEQAGGSDPSFENEGSSRIDLICARTPPFGV